MTRCRICNRELTNEVSQRIGIGPDCLEQAIAEAPTERLLKLRAEYASAAAIRSRAVPDTLTGDLFDEEQHG